MNTKEFEADLVVLINRHSLENESNTPDFIIARLMTDAYFTFVKGVNRREQWYGREPGAGGMQTYDGECLHGKGLSDYCSPCGRVNGS